MGSLPSAAALAALLLAAPPARADAGRRPSLAKINGLLDVARDAERKKDYAAAVPAYAGVLAEVGDPAPRDMEHIAAKALVQSGSALLALGRLDEAQAAYAAAVARFGGAGGDATRDHIRRARALVGRVAELRSLIKGTPPPSATPAGTEPLILVTERTVAGGGADQRGFEVKSFDGDEAALIRAAERAASADGRKVLETGRDMALVRRDILPGSCWDYIDAVYTRAGYQENHRRQPYKSVKRGPYAEVNRLQPGDWMYYVNHSFGNSEHSGIFVGWINGPGKVALVLSYPGNNRAEPGRYRPYELTSVFGILRPSAARVVAD